MLVYENEDVRVFHGDCLQILPTLEDGSFDTVVTDPPYYRIKDEPWDKQWDSPETFLAWLGLVANEWRRVLKPSGSLYVFASPRMAAGVELLIGEGFHVINAITWQKDFPCGALKYGAENFRGFVEMSERIIFAEQSCGGHGAIGSRIRAARLAAGLSCKFLDEKCRPSGRGTGLAYLWEHPFSKGGCIPYPHQYVAAMHACGDFRSIRELEEEFAGLRRPFFARPDRPHHDVWTYKPVSQSRLAHPCEKPHDLLSHIIEVSTRPGDVVLDCFGGSGATAQTCMKTGRKCILIEKDSRYIDTIIKRLKGAETPLFSASEQKPPGDEHLQRVLPCCDTTDRVS